jgi:glycosyltransferase involved in cell wall biosynthesis
MKKRKLLVWHYNLLLYWNGGTKFVHTIAKGLLSEYRVVIIANAVNPEVSSRFKESGIEVKVFYRWPKQVYLHRFMMPLGIIVDAIRALPLMRKADYVVATAFPSNIVCALASMISRIKFNYYCFEPTVMFFDDAFIEGKSGLEKVQWKIASKIYRVFDTWAVRKASSVLTLTKTTRKQIKKIYRIDSFPTEVGVQTEFFYPRKDSWFKTKYIGKTIIAHSTDYQPEKRLDIVIKAFDRLAKNHPDLLLLVTSTNPSSSNKSAYESLIKKLGISDKVKLLGFIDFDKVPDLYSAAVCYISTASGLQYGVTSANLPVKEAMACGTAVIRAPVDNEDVVDGVTGFMVDPDNMDLLSKRLGFLLENKLRAKEMGSKGIKVIESRFQWDKVISAFKQNLVENIYD